MESYATNAAGRIEREPLEILREDALRLGVVWIVDVDVRRAAVREEACLPRSDLIFGVESDQSSIAEQDAGPESFRDGNEAVIGENDEDGRIPNAVLPRFSDHAGHLRVGGFGGGDSFGAERTVLVFFVIEHRNVQQQEIRFQICDGVAGNVGEGGVGFRGRRNPGGEIRKFFGDRFENAWR